MRKFGAGLASIAAGCIVAAILPAAHAEVAGDSHRTRAAEDPTQVPPVIIKKVDQNGHLLPGGHFIGEACVRSLPSIRKGGGSSGANWSCQHLEDYGWFRDGLFETGKADKYTTEIPLWGSKWDRPILQCVWIKETSAPEGYKLANGPEMTACLGPGGWTVENAKEIGFTGTQAAPGDPTAGDWDIKNIENKSTTFTLINTKPGSPGGSDGSHSSGSGNNDGGSSNHDGNSDINASANTGR